MPGPLRTYLPLALAIAALGSLAACDLVRTPWDEGAPPTVPDTPEPLPPGAPGPPPPTDPVDDPYGYGDANDASDTSDATTDTPTTDIPDATDTNGTSETDAPETGTPDDTGSPGTDTDTAPVEDTDTVDVTPPSPPPEPVFSYHAAGALLPGSGQGAAAQIVHAPDMVFPIAGTPAYLQSQVFSFGGGIGGGDQCDVRNYTYPWRDNFCETRSRNRTSPFCPTSKVHQGQDIRVGTPADCSALRQADSVNRALHRVVAVEDGTISHIGTYSVNLRSGGRIYKYMHMNMTALQVAKYDTVRAGDLLGYVSNDFGGTPTTFHLHFEIVQNTGAEGWAHVPPYLSLVEAYERRENGPGEVIEVGDVAIAAAPIVIPDGFEIIE